MSAEEVTKKVTGAGHPCDLGTMNPDTTIVSGIICNACGKKLPPMTMTDHLEGNFNKTCPHLVIVPKPKQICPTCGKSVIHLKEHMAYNHGVIPTVAAAAVAAASPAPVEPRAQVCGHCGKSVVRLSEHIKYIHGDGAIGAVTKFNVLTPLEHYMEELFLGVYDVEERDGQKHMRTILRPCHSLTGLTDWAEGFLSVDMTDTHLITAILTSVDFQKVKTALQQKSL